MVGQRSGTHDPGEVCQVGKESHGQDRKDKRAGGGGATPLLRDT